MSDQNKVIDLSAFRNASTQASKTITPSVKERFVAFDMEEQKAIMSLHAEFSAASRDYSYSFDDASAAITLLACFVTREELARFTKELANPRCEEQGFVYTVSGTATSAHSSANLDDVIEHARIGLSERATTELNTHKTNTRRAGFKLL